MPGEINPQGAGSGLDADTLDGKHVDEIGSPAGSVIMFAAATPPTGWLACTGSAISRSTYAALFSAIGTSYGAGDGSTTFNIPDLRSRVPVGTGAGGSLTTRSEGQSGGAETHTLTIPEMPAHTHTIGFNSVPNAGGNVGTRAYTGSSDTSSAGGGEAHNNMQPWLGINFIIKT